MITESSLDTIGLRTFGGGLGVHNMADQESAKNMPKCAEGGGWRGFID